MVKLFRPQALRLFCRRLKPIPLAVFLSPPEGSRESSPPEGSDGVSSPPAGSDGVSPPEDARRAQKALFVVELRSRPE